MPWNDDWRQELNALSSWQDAHIVVVVVAQFNMCIISKREGSLVTHNWDVNVTVVLRCRFHFPSCNTTVVW